MKSLSRVRLFANLWTACSPPGSSIHGILQAKNTGVCCHFLLQGSSRPRDQTQVSRIAGRCFNLWATREAYRMNLIRICKGITWLSPRYNTTKASLVAQMVKNLPSMQETWVWSLGWEDPLEEGMATHSIILAWRTPWTEEPGRL